MIYKRYKRYIKENGIYNCLAFCTFELDHNLSLNWCFMRVDPSPSTCSMILYVNNFLIENERNDASERISIYLFLSLYLFCCWLFDRFFLLCIFFRVCLKYAALFRFQRCLSRCVCLSCKLKWECVRPVIFCIVTSVISWICLETTTTKAV